MIEYHLENAEHFEEEKGLMKVIEINTSNHHSDKIRKAAGQVNINIVFEKHLLIKFDIFVMYELGGGILREWVTIIELFFASFQGRFLRNLD